MKKLIRLIALTSVCLTCFAFLAKAATDDLITGWTLVAPVLQPIAYHRIASSGDKILMIGGEVPIWTTPTAPILQAQVEADGSIEQWTTPAVTGGTTSLPEPLHRHALVQVRQCTRDALYVIGGFSNGNRYAQVWRTDWDAPVGQLSGWSEARNYPRKIILHEALYANERLYVLGGLNEADQPLDEVYSAVVDSNGDLAAWLKEANLPKPLYRLAAVTYAVEGRQYVYAIGGYDGAQFQQTLYMTEIGDNDKLRDWKKIGSLPRALAYHRAVIVGNHLIVIGGMGNDGSYNEVYSALLDTNGKLGEWHTEANLPDSISRFAAITVTVPHIQGPRLYVIGGTNGDQLRAQVYRSPPLIPTSVPNLYTTYLPVVQHC